jgi:hypothetical protein
MFVSNEILIAKKHCAEKETKKRSLQDRLQLETIELAVALLQLTARTTH